MPSGVAAVWLMTICAPTVICSGASSIATHSAAVFSTSAPSAGVLNTSGVPSTIPLAKCSGEQTTESEAVSPGLRSSSAMIPSRLEAIIGVSSGPVSRILSAPKNGATISLDATSLRRSSSQPGSTNGPGDPSPLFGLAPGGVCTAALLPGRRCALTAPFQPYPSEDRRYVSVALSVGSRRPGVTWHPCPVESGLSSGEQALQRPHGPLDGSIVARFELGDARWRWVGIRSHTARRACLAAIGI